MASTDHFDAVEHAEDDARTDRSHGIRSEVSDAIRKAGRLLATDTDEAYVKVLDGLQSFIIPKLSEYSGRELWEYDSELDENAEWYWQAVRALDRRAGELQHQARHGNARAHRTIRRALKSVSAAAAHEGIVLESYAGRVDAHGFAGKVGENIQDREMDLGDPVRVVSDKSGALKSLFTGGTGNGKSVALEAEAEDYYRRNFQDGRDFKLIDPAGLRDGENWFYDIPQQDPDLQRVRDDQDLPKTFLGEDRDVNQVDIKAPLTPSLREQQLPYDVDDERFSVQPFTIPAADIRKPLLVSILTAKLTPEQESIIRDAYDEVDRQRDDWALADLAQEIKSRDELKASKQKPPIRTLRQLQSRGFIRTRDCEYTLNWREIFESTEKYTVFSQSFLDTSIAQLIVFGYLANSIVKKRESMYGIPEAVVVMRELWKIAPHKQRQEFDERAAQLQEAIGHMFARLFRDNRHSGVHVLTDTQQPSDLLKPIREMFNRYVVFETDRDTVKDIFEWTANDNWRSFYSTLTPKPGEASITGMVEPAINNRHIQFLGPVKYASASHHHKRDRGVDSNGWHARAKYFSPITECPGCDSDEIVRSDDGATVTCEECGEETRDYSGGRCEELRTPDEMDVSWPFDVPTRLVIESESGDSDTIDPAMQPVAAFVKGCVLHEPDKSVTVADVKTAFNEFVIDHPDIDRDEPWDFDDMGTSKRFGDRLHDAVDGEIRRTTKGGDHAYGGITLNRRGSEFVSAAMDGLEDSSSALKDR